VFFDEQMISVDYFSSQWFITLFTYDVSDHTTAIIIIVMTLIFGQAFLYKVVLQLLREARDQHFITSMSYEQALMFLKELVPKILISNCQNKGLT
jgi:hypothetical protein